jgi:hypothetical protein
VRGVLAPAPWPCTRPQGRSLGGGRLSVSWAGRLWRAQPAACACPGLDLRDMRGLQCFVAHMLGRYQRLDCLVNNATQTIRRPCSYYAHLLPIEQGALVSGRFHILCGRFDWDLPICCVFLS